MAPGAGPSYGRGPHWNTLPARADPPARQASPQPAAPPRGPWWGPGAGTQGCKRRRAAHMPHLTVGGDFERCEPWWLC